MRTRNSPIWDRCNYVKLIYYIVQLLGNVEDEMARFIGVSWNTRFWGNSIHTWVVAHKNRMENLKSLTPNGNQEQVFRKYNSKPNSISIYMTKYGGLRDLILGPKHTTLTYILWVFHPTVQAHAGAIKGEAEKDFAFDADVVSVSKLKTFLLNLCWNGNDCR